ncbi:hypothetical protein ACFLYT_00405 [Nanoarchaeota archaeon]
MYSVYVNVTDSDGYVISSDKKVFYVCNDLNSSGSGWTCTKADMDNDGSGEGLFTTLYGESKSCDNCPSDYNPSQADINANGVGDDCELKVTLTNPSDGESITSTSIIFVCNVVSEANLSMIELYTNIGDSFISRANISVNGTTENVSFIMTEVELGTYEWNCKATDVNNLTNFAPANYSVIRASPEPLTGGPGSAGGGGGGGGGPGDKKIVPTCSDGIKNQNEVLTDCGGPCLPCVAGPSCYDDIWNQDEEGVDCGGRCVSCEPAPSCSDNVKNQGEDEIDCGGPCLPCDTCSDDVMNYGEEGIDCGGPCLEECPVIVVERPVKIMPRQPTCKEPLIYLVFIQIALALGILLARHAIISFKLAARLIRYFTIAIMLVILAGIWLNMTCYYAPFIMSSWLLLLCIKTVGLYYLHRTKRKEEFWLKIEILKDVNEIYTLLDEGRIKRANKLYSEIVMDYLQMSSKMQSEMFPVVRKLHNIFLKDHHREKTSENGEIKVEN